MLFVTEILSCLSIAVILYYLICCQEVLFIKRLNNIPGPKTWPFLGSYQILLNRMEFLDIMRRMTEEYSSPFQMWMGGNLLIGIYDPQQAKHILRNRNCIDKSIMYKLAEPLFGMGLLTAPASIWTRIRKIAAFTFSPSMLQNFFKIFVEESEILVHQLQKNDLNGNEIDLHDHISNCSWRMACGSLMGIKLEQEKNKEYVKAIQRLKNNIIYRVRNKLFFDCIFYITALGRNHKKDTDFINSLSDEMIQQLTHDLNNPNTKDGNSRTHRTFFEILTEASRKNNFTREEIHDNVMTMLLGANDTITSLINFVTFLLGSFPEVQEKVYKELCEIYGTKSTKDAPVMYEDLQYMCYLDGVIKETMRIFPTVPLISRKATKDIKIGDKTLPKGANIIVEIFHIHRNDKYWPNPLKFDPERFLRGETKHSEYYIPFSNGPRNCIGMKYAMISTKVILATLIRTFKFKVNKKIEIGDIKLKFDFVLSTQEPLKVQIEKRIIK